eukprot:2283453-Prymnesium_polylepis.2
MCAATGKLPGQAGSLIHFASAPKDLELHEWVQPSSWPCRHGSCPEGKYSVGDVFFAEVAVFRMICRNAGELFRVEVGERMTCDVDVSAYNELARLLLASSS